MSSTDVRYPAASGSASPPVVTPHYGSSLPNPPTDIEGARNTRCATGVRFITTIHGILNVVIIIALICVVISAGVAKRQDGRVADSIGDSRAKVSAFHTRNAVLVFAVFGLFLMIADTVLHMTALINRLPSIFDKVFIIVMLVFGGIYLILACCAAAWEKKMNDTAPVASLAGYNYSRKGAAAAASFFLFVAMFAVIGNFVLRLVRSPSRLDR